MLYMFQFMQLEPSSTVGDIKSRLHKSSECYLLSFTGFMISNSSTSDCVKGCLLLSKLQLTSA